MARSYKRDKNGRFAGGGSSAPSGTIAKGGNGVRGSVARSTAALGKAAPSAAGQKPRLQVKKGAKLVMKEGINSPSGKARAGLLKAESAERKASKQVTAAKKAGKSPAAQAKQRTAFDALQKAQKAKVKAVDALVKATRRR